MAGGFSLLPMPTPDSEGTALGISANGKVVVGTASIGTAPVVACYWPDIHSQPVLFASDYPRSAAYAATSDGSMIAGNLGDGYPFTWTESTGIVTFGAPGGDSTHAMTPDGRFIVGATRISISPQLGQACYWDADRFQTKIPMLPGHNASAALGVSADGVFIVGWSQLFDGSFGTHTLRGFRWNRLSGELIDLGLAPPGIDSRAFDISDDGNLVGGDQSVGGNGAFAWTPQRGIFIPPLLLPEGSSTVTCVSGDGGTMGGYAQLPYPPGPFGKHFCYWTPGITIPTPVQMDPDDPDLGDGVNETYPSDVSHDGTMFCGYTFGFRAKPWVYEVAEWSGVCIPPEPINASDPVPVEEPVTAWTLEPDWANGVTERLSWKTDVLTSQTGIEQRRRLRNSPRRQIEAAYTLIGSDRRLYDNLMQGPAAGFWHHPAWWEKFFLTVVAPVGGSTAVCGSTTGTEIAVGDTVVLLGRTPFIHEVAEIASVTPTEFGFASPLTRQWPVGSVLYLTRRCRLIAAQRGQRRADDAAQVTLTFETTEPNDYTGVPPTYALDYPVLELLPNEADETTEEYKRILAEFDNQTAAVPIRRDLGGRTFMLQQFAYLTRGRAELAALRGLLYYLQGKLVPVYVPTYTRDVELMPGFFGVAGGTTLAVRRSGYPDYTLEHNASRRLLMLWFRDGAVTAYNVTGATIVNDDQETLTVDPPLDRGVGNSTVWRMCWMALSRQDQDDIEILHHADGRGPTTMTTTFATLAEGRHAEPYSTNPWNGSFRRTDGVPIPPPPDGGITAPDLEPVEYGSLDYGGGEGGSGEGSPSGGGGTDSGASGGAAGEGSGGGGPGGGGDAGEGGDE